MRRGRSLLHRRPRQFHRRGPWGYLVIWNCRTPMSDPPCDGRTIVVLGNITTPGMYPAGVQGLLDAHPGVYYLRTDQSCPSLRQASDEGNPIYTVFEFAGTTRNLRRVLVFVQRVVARTANGWTTHK